MVEGARRVVWSCAIGVVLGSIGLAIASRSDAIAPPPMRGAAMVAADHELASTAGAEILRAGGNAADAAVAAALAAGVVQPSSSGLGGGGFAVVMLGGKPLVLDFREVAPSNARADRFVKPDGGVDPLASTRGPKAVGVVAEPRGLAALAQRHGKLSLKQIAAPAIRYAAQGFPLGHHLSGALQRTDVAAVKSLFSFGRAGAVEGEIVKRPALAKTLTQWARTGGDALNTGEGARAIEEATE